jgi:hypothetical protein
VGRQVGFYLHPDDEPDFDRFLKSFGEVVLVPHLQRTGTLTTVPDTLTASRGGFDYEGSRIYLVRPGDLASVQLEHQPSEGYWLVDEAPLAGLHFDRCGLRSDRLLEGRLYFQTRYVRDGRWADPPEDFVRWADRIVRGARRKLRKVTLPVGDRTATRHMSPAAEAWMHARHAGLRPGYLALIAADADPDV